MRVLIYEHFCGGGMQDKALPADLAASGAGMLQSALRDFVAAGCEVTTTLDYRWNIDSHGAQVLRNYVEPVETDVYREARNAHMSLIIAPETDGVLLNWAQRLERWNVPTLGASPAAIKLCTNKNLTSIHLRAAELPTLETRCGQSDQLEPWIRKTIDTTQRPVVVKPVDSAGSDRVLVLRNHDDASQFASLQHKGEWLAQPFIVGQSLSMSFIVTPNAVHPLLIGEQTIGGGQQLRYEGGTIPAQNSETEIIVSTATAAVRSIPGLNGFVGVDMVVERTTGTPFIVDINPRLTMSYCALSTLSKVNLASVMLGQAVPDQWYAGRLTFNASGQITGGNA